MSPAKKAAKAAKKSTRKSTAKKSVARKASAKKASAKKSTAKKATAKKSTARIAKKAPAKKSAAKKPAVKKAAAKKATAKKSAPTKAPRRTAAGKKAAPAPKQALGRESVDAYIAAIADPGRRQDLRTLVEIFSQATGKQPKRWGPQMIVFGKYHYKYASGHEGDSCLAGFAARKGALTLYLSPEDSDRGALLRRLGKHREGKGCVYLKDLDGVDLEVLGDLVRSSADSIRRKYPVED